MEVREQDAREGIVSKMHRTMRPQRWHILMEGYSRGVKKLQRRKVRGQIQHAVSESSMVSETAWRPKIYLHEHFSFSTLPVFTHHHLYAPFSVSVDASMNVSLLHLVLQSMQLSVLQ
jgi:hypothetical protein